MNCPWSQFEKDPFPFCEEQLCQIIGQPANTWSNIGYFVAAWLIWRHHKNALFAGVSLYLAIGSTLFHMSGAMWAKLLDVSAMLLLSGLCLTLALQIRFHWRRSVSVGFFALMCALAVPLIGNGKLGGYLFVGQVVATSVLEFMRRHQLTQEQKHSLLHVLLVFPVALGLNMMDQHGPLCWPTNHIFTVHGLWHLMTAYCIYRISHFYGATS
jgi:hypothetical protein